MTRHLPIGSYNQFVTAVLQFPMLTVEQELEYARAFRNDGDLDAAHQLVTSHLRLVVSVARQYEGYHIPQADMVQEGTVGLMKAVKKFDPDKGIRLSAYAIPHIKSEIVDYAVKTGRIVKIATTKAQRKLFFNLRNMKTSRTLSREQAISISEQLNVSLQDVLEMDTRLTGGDVPFDLTTNPTDDEFAVGDVLADENSNPVELLNEVEQDIEHRQHIDLMHAAINSLSERDQDIVRSRLLTDTPTTLKELSDKYGVSIERVRQIEVKSIARIKKHITDQQRHETKH